MYVCSYVKYVFLLSRLFRSGYSGLFYCSLYCLCVNEY
jgi:hypothetical protein